MRTAARLRQEIMANVTERIQSETLGPLVQVCKVPTAGGFGRVWWEVFLAFLMGVSEIDISDVPDKRIEKPQDGTFFLKVLWSSDGPRWRYHWGV